MREAFGIVKPSDEGTLSLVARSAEVTEAVVTSASGGVSDLSLPIQFVPLGSDTRLRWTVSVEPGVYNPQVLYDAPDTPPMLRLRVGDGRELRDTP